MLRELGLLATRSLEICAGSAHWSTGMNNIIGLDTEKHDITTSVLASCVAWKKLAFQSSQQFIADSMEVVFRNAQQCTAIMIGIVASASAHTQNILKY